MRTAPALPTAAPATAVLAATLADRVAAGPRRLCLAIEALGGVVAAWDAPMAAWRDALMRSGDHRPRAADLARSLERLAFPAREQRRREIAAAVARHGLTVLTWWDPSYPFHLREIADPPCVLYVRGRLLPQQDWLAVAIVGSREAEPPGLLAAHGLAQALAARGITVVSGLALGIDGAAHRGALAAGGRTIGVAPCGLDHVYPPAHHHLYRVVAGKGALVSEQAPGVGVSRWQLARRNRLIAGLSLAVVVVEAREGSGALRTAETARDQGREVLVVPGDINRPTCAGSNRMLRDGALPCLEPDDVVMAIDSRARRIRQALGLVASTSGVAAGAVDGAAAGAEAPASAATAPPPPAGDRLWQALASQPRSVDQLCAASGLSVGEVLARLTALEAAGHVVRLPGGQVRRAAGGQGSV